jgi:very-short-patch-repair endonuclease
MKARRAIPPSRTMQYVYRLREDMTACERLLKSKLERRGFLAQVPLYGFIADFYHPAYRVVVEADGAHHAEQRTHDRRRDEVLRTHGNTVLRSSNRQIVTGVAGVVARIDRELLLRSAVVKSKPGGKERW